MEEKLVQKTCADFVSELATKSPVPGGGGASALVGAIAVALGNMVASLTIGKKKYIDVEEDIIRLQKRAYAIQDKLLELVDEDAKAFEPLSKAYSMPKETQSQIEEKERVMEDSLVKASLVPYKIMEVCIEAIDIIEELAQKGSRLAISDAGVGAGCLEAAIKGSALNVFINTKSMKNRTYADELNQKTNELLNIGTSKANEIYENVKNRL